MKNTFSYLASSIVDHPEAIAVDEDVGEGKTILTLHAHPEDMGKIIGKSGRIIKALRDLIKILAAKKNTYVDIILDDA